MTTKELVKYLNDLNIIQKYRDLNDEFCDNLPEDIFEEYFENAEEVESYLNPIRHRWYEIATNIYKINDGYIGCTYVNKVYSESMCVADIDHILQFNEYKQKETITYIPV